MTFTNSREKDYRRAKNNRSRRFIFGETGRWSIQKRSEFEITQHASKCERKTLLKRNSHTKHRSRSRLQVRSLMLMIWKGLIWKSCDTKVLLNVLQRIFLENCSKKYGDSKKCHQEPAALFYMLMCYLLFLYLIIVPTIVGKIINK